MKVKRIRKILLGVDLAHFSEDTIKFAVETAKIRRSKLTVMFVYRSVHPIINLATPKKSSPNEIENCKSELISLCEKHIPKSVDWEAVVIEGKPIYQTIVRAAQKISTDLIILGEHDRHQQDEILLGSNAEKIARYAPCSVLILKNR